jgi:hypothetical protein
MLPGGASPGLQLAHSSPAKAPGGKKKGPTGRKRVPGERVQDSSAAVARLKAEEVTGLGATQEENPDSVAGVGGLGAKAKRGRRAKASGVGGTQESSLESADTSERGAARRAGREENPRVRARVTAVGTQESGLATQESGLATQPATQQSVLSSQQTVTTAQEHGLASQHPSVLSSQQSGLATQQSGLATVSEAIPTQLRFKKNIKGSTGLPSQSSASQISGLATREPSRAVVKRFQRLPVAQVAPRSDPSQVSGFTQVSGQQPTRLLVSVDESSQSVAGELVTTPDKGLGRLERRPSLSIMPYDLSPSAEVENAASQGAGTPSKVTPDGKRRKKSIRPQRPPFRPV